MEPTTVYLVTKQYRSKNPHERSIEPTIEAACAYASKISDGETPDDIDSWEKMQGNQHRLSRWRHWYRTANDDVANIYIRSFFVDGEA